MNSLIELKNIIASMNKKIRDDDITAFHTRLSHIDRQDDNTDVAPLLKMMRSLGTYLRSKKNKAHADALPLLTSMADQLISIMDAGNPEPGETRQIVSEQMDQYMTLKNKIASRPEVNDIDMQDLKAVMLAIDWEISNTTLQNFEEVVSNLLARLKNYKIHHSFLKIIHSVGRYIGSQRANAHTDAISFLRSVFENFEHIVQTPAMSFAQKKQLLRADINRFHEFKVKIFQQKKPGQAFAARPEEDAPAPALSHIRSASEPMTEAVIPLTSFEEPGTITPALAGRTGPPDRSTDIMDDLFNIKESPADELLDAIHLLDVHGATPKNDLNHLDSTENKQADGVKNFTPQRMGTDPIPEISDRLDEFFSLDTPPSPLEDKGPTAEETIEIMTAADMEPSEGLVPFHDEDEIEDAALPNDAGADRLARLESAIDTLEWQTDASILMSVNQDISELKTFWHKDDDKTCLLQIISSAVNAKSPPKETVQQQKDTGIDESMPVLSDVRPENPMGLWEKLKKIFSA